MAKVVATTNNNLEEGNGMLDKFNLDQLLSKDFIRDEDLHNYFKGQTTEKLGILDNAYNSIEEFLSAALDSCHKDMNTRVNNFISEKIVSIIKDFDEIQLRKKHIEEQIKEMERQSSQFEDDNDIENQMKRMEHRIKMNELNQQYEAICKAYIDAYTKGLKETMLHEDFNHLISEVKSTENELFKRIEFERAVLETKLQVLDILSHKVGIQDHLRMEINLRLKTREDYADKIIRSSNMRIPVIQAIVK